MKKPLKLILGIALLSFICQLTLSAQSSTATLHFDLNECTAFMSNGSNMDFSEFTAEATNSEDANISVIGGHLYRNDPATFKHSCTPGVNETEGMCVNYDPSCTYIAGSPYSIIIDISVDPINNQPVSLSELQFYEQAPQQFEWVSGIIGNNNYPTLYGIRILKNDIEIFAQTDLGTSADWSLENFNFSELDDFTVIEPTNFSIELLAYCPSGSFGDEMIWDLDEITISVTSEAISGFPSPTQKVRVSIIGLERVPA